MNDTSDPTTRSKPKLPATVIALGLASLFNDFGSEMCFPLMPIVLISLGAGPTFLGLVDGIADATSSLVKILTGYFADRYGRMKRMVLLGYGLPSFVRPLLAIAAAPWHVLGIRVVDRIGKGLRTSPRDSLIAASVSSQNSGRAFGFQRALDHTGALLGSLTATVLMWLGMSMKGVFLAALVPSLLSLFAVGFLREPARAAAQPLAELPSPKSARVSRKFKGYLGIMALFALANSSDMFLILRASEIGVAQVSLPLLWAVLHVSRAACTTLGGRLADRFSRARLLAAGWIVFALCYVGMGFARETWQVWALFVVYGLHTGICEPAERAIVRDLEPAATHGRAFGLFHGVIGACAIPAGLLTGWIWESWNARLAFSVGAGISLAAAAALVIWERKVANR